MVAVDGTGLPVAARVLPSSVHDNKATRAVLAEAERWGSADRLELVLVDRGVTRVGAGRISTDTGVEVRRVGWDDKQPVFRRIRHAWRVEVAHGRVVRATPDMASARFAPTRGRPDVRVPQYRDRRVVAGPIANGR